jgi:dsDNA-binding SOS-regulon protein
MTQQVLKQGYQTADGKIFDTKKEALDYLRRPQKEAALNKLTNNAELTSWLLENEEAVESIFESTKIRRVTKMEKKHLETAMDKLVHAHATVAEDGAVSNIEKGFAFLVENASAIVESFRWPSVKRGTDEEQAATIKNGFLELTGKNEELSVWLIENKDAVLEGFQAGIVKQDVPQKTKDALAAYQAKRAAQKAEKEAAAKAAAPAA